MRRRLAGSYTIEAVLVMAVVLWTLAATIQYGYGIGSRTKASMKLHESLEKSRQNSEDKTVKGDCRVGKWSLEIRMDAFRPEEFLRMSTLFEALEVSGLAENTDTE